MLREAAARDGLAGRREAVDDHDQVDIDRTHDDNARHSVEPNWGARARWQAPLRQPAAGRPPDLRTGTQPLAARHPVRSGADPRAADRDHDAGVAVLPHRRQTLQHRLQVAPLACLAIGQLFVILVGGIELSVGSLLALCTVTGALAYGWDFGGPLVIPMMLATGVAVGWVTQENARDYFEEVRGKLGGTGRGLDR
ncbi:MAG TPA: hypothetical protein VFZ00_30520 [Solirubrobacter sp.]|nr:hypothetical protein [Solirubrobacter sp.]